MKSPVTEFVGDGGKSRPRTRKIIGYGWHHTAGNTYEGNKAVMRGNSREVSCNTLISRLNIGEVTNFNRRAYTTADSLDDWSLTSEVVNDVGAPNWDFNDETYASCALMAAYAYIEYGVPLRRATFYGDAGHWTHGGAYSNWGVSYATACPGSLDVDRILSEAAAIVGVYLTGGVTKMEFIEVVRNEKDGATYILSKLTGRKVHIKDPEEYQMFVGLGLVPKDQTKIKSLPEWSFWRYVDTYEKLGFGK